MPSVAQTFVREPGSHDPGQYHQRVVQLAWAYLSLFLFSIAGVILLVWQGQLFVALAQRSNVETLVLAFFLMFFAYILIISAPGALGAIHVFRFELQRRWAKDPVAVERLTARRLGPPRGDHPIGALNLVVERNGLPGQSFEMTIVDAAGSLGAIRVDGAELSHQSTVGEGSNTLLAFFVHQVNDVLGRRGYNAELDVVEWQTIDDSSAQVYLRNVQFARNLERTLGAEELWPKITLTDDDCRELEGRLSKLCPALLAEAFLPDWEYSGEHKLPIVPEPLGLVSLGRSERRVDPLASMGCAVIVVVGIVIVLGLFILFPPWVPGV
jgi:hypothetical protein